jgi:adenylate cyclase
MRFPFRLKIALLTATFSAVPLLVVGWLLIDVNAREVESNHQALRIAVTERVAAQIDDELSRARRTLGAIGTALTDTTLEEHVRVTLALRLLDAGGLEVAGIYDAEGALIDRMRDPDVEEATTPETIDRALRDRADLAGAALGEVDAESQALLVIPLRAGDRTTGYVVTPFSLAGTQALVTRLSTSQLASDEGALFVVDGARRILAHPDRARVGRVAPGFDVAAVARMPISEERTIGGRTLITTSVGLDDAPWAIVAEIPEEVMYASIARMRTIVIATIAGTLLAAFLAAFVFARLLTAPIGKLVAFTRSLAARDFDARVDVGTKDELAVLGSALSDAAKELGASEARIREEMAIRADLRRYLPAELVDAIIRREQSMELGGRRLPITVLFADVVAFTPLSERLPPEQVVALLNELFTLLTEAVFRHGGTVDKFVGDCVMAIWGAPAPSDDHAERAVLAAQDMLRFLESANAEWKARFGTGVQLAIGVNTGDAVVGNVGSETRMEYTAIGDVVNVAARLETVARPQQILVSRATADAVGDAFELARVGEREVPGRTAPIELFEVSW